MKKKDSDKFYSYYDYDDDKYLTTKYLKELTDTISNLRSKQSQLFMSGWLDFLDGEGFNIEKEPLTTKEELLDLLRNENIKMVEVYENIDRILINDGTKEKTYNIDRSDFNSTLKQFIYNWTKNHYCQWVFSYMKMADVVFVNLDRHTYDELKSSADFKLSLNFTSPSESVIYLYDTKFDLNEKILEIMFERYPDVKLEYLRHTRDFIRYRKKDIEEKEKEIEVAMKNDLYEVTEEDELIMEVMD